MEKLSAKIRRVTKRRKDVEKPHYNWLQLVIFPAWTLFAFIASIFLVAGAAWLLGQTGVLPSGFSDSALYQTILSVTVYIVAISVVIGVPYLARRWRTTMEDLGLQRAMSWTDIGLSPVAFLVYLLVMAVVIGLVTVLLPSFPFNESQDVGFSPYGSRGDMALAFLTLVVVAPIAEEVLFRGYLYGKLKRYVPVIWAAVVSSLVFALVHFQLSVGLDTFVLGMILCGLRSLTGSIWSSILVHMIKNAVAYYMIMNPLVGG